MSFTRSIRDTLAELSAEVKRNISDMELDYLGTKTQVLRIEVGERDLLGDQEETLVTNFITNVYIKHPMGNNIWLFSTVDNEEIQTDAVNLWEILPVTMKIKYNANYDEEPVAIKENDLIVEILEDENGNNLPIIYQITKLTGGFESKYLYEKWYEMALYRGTIPSDIQYAIDNYIDQNT